MGRPLWRSCAAQDKKGKLLCSNPDKADLLAVVAKKLLLGANIAEKSAFAKTNMFGVASVLCRVGLRPYSSSALALRSVADFMATLCYVNHKRDLYVVNYFSDPMLTFGGAQVWHRHSNMLAERILPQLKELYMQEALDTGEIGETVARIVLLLAIDKCAEVSGVDASSLSEFHSVPEFMNVLRGSVELRKCGDVGVVKRTLDSNWKKWKLGFSHFMQVTKEPSENCLWYLLSRQAAGMFPRNQGGADLFIPIFTTDENGQNPKVSMILVQVKNYADGYFGYKTAVKKLHPKSVFADANPLKQRDPSEFLRVVMRMQKNTKSSYEYDESCPSESTCVLFMEAITTNAFVSDSVAKQLDLLLTPWWDLLNLVEADLTLRKVNDDSPHVVPTEELREIAEMPVHDLLHIDDPIEEVDEKVTKRQKS